MKVLLSDLKKAIEFIEKNSNELKVTIKEFDGKLEVSAFDRADQSMVVVLHPEGTMMPTVRKTERL